MMYTYKEVLNDWKYLFKEIGPAYDMSDGYVDQIDLHKLLRNPTRKMATNLMLRQIAYWFDVGPGNEPIESDKNLKRLIANDPKVSRLSEKYLGWWP